MNITRLAVASAVGVLAVTVVSGCSGDETTVDVDGTWTLVAVDGERIEEGVNTRDMPVLRLTGGQLLGDFGCNRGSATYEQSGTTVTFTLGDTSAELCSIPADADELVLSERALVAVMDGEEASVDITGDDMVWTSPTHVLTLQRN